MIDKNKKLQQLNTFTWKETKSNEEERLEIDAMNNDNIPAKLVQKEGGYTIGTSNHNKKWIQKGVDRYNARVWRGWREKE